MATRPPRCPHPRPAPRRGEQRCRLIPHDYFLLPLVLSSGLNPLSLSPLHNAGDGRRSGAVGDAALGLEDPVVSSLSRPSRHPPFLLLLFESCCCSYFV